jgi:hypothetical protein
MAVLFYLNVTTFSSDVKDFLILVSRYVRLGPSKTIRLSNDALHMLKYLKKRSWKCLYVFVQGEFQTSDSLLDVL